MVERKLLKGSGAFDKSRSFYGKKLKSLYDPPVTQRCDTQFSNHLVNFQSGDPGVTIADLKLNRKLDNCREVVKEI